MTQGDPSREAIKRTMIRVAKTVPGHDPWGVSWPHERARAYAESAVRTGLVDGRRIRGGGGEGIRRMTPVFRGLLGRFQHESLIADRMIEEAGREGSPIRAIVAPNRLAGRNPEWTIDDALEAGVVCMTHDPAVFSMACAPGCTPYGDDRSPATIIAAWRDDAGVYLHALAVAGGIHGVRTFVLDYDGTLANIPANRTVRYDADADRLLGALSTVVSHALTTLAETKAPNREPAKADVAESASEPVEPASDPAPAPRAPSWDEASRRVDAPLLSAGAGAPLRHAVEPNKVLRRLVDELGPMIDGSGLENADPRLLGSSPYEAVASMRAIATGEVDRMIATIRENARLHVARHRAGGDEGEALRTEALAARALGDEAYPDVVGHSVRQRLSHLEPVHNAAARLLAAFSERADLLASGSLVCDPDLDEETVSSSQDAFGLHTVRCPELHEAVVREMDARMSAKTDLPLVVLYHAHESGASVLVTQLCDGRPSMGAWRSIPAVPQDGEDDASWAMRRIVASSMRAAGGRDAEPPRPAAAERTAPEGPTARTDESPAAIPATRPEDASRSVPTPIPAARRDGPDDAADHPEPPPESGWSSSGFEGLLDDPEDGLPEEQGDLRHDAAASGRPPAARPSGGARRTAKRDAEFAAMLAKAMEPVLERLAVIEDLLRNR